MLKPRMKAGAAPALVGGIVLLGCAFAAAAQQTGQSGGQPQPAPRQATQPGQPGQTGQISQPGQAGQSGQQGQAGGAAAAPVSAKEAEAFNAVRNEAAAGLDPVKVVQLAGDFEKTYPNSTLLSTVLAMGASAYQQQGNINQALDWAQKSVKMKSDELMALIVLADLLPTPQSMHSATPAQKDQKLTQTETYAERALKQISEFTKQPNETDDQLAKRKAGFSAELHSDLGMLHLQRAQEGLTGVDKDELAKAEAEYKIATSTAEKPSAADYYRMGECYNLEGKVPEAIDAFTKAAQAGAGGPIQQYAEKQIAALKKQGATK
jgi:tetratricopeptide (TPR) repeat protein